MQANHNQVHIYQWDWYIIKERRKEEEQEKGETGEKKISESKGKLDLWALSLYRAESPGFMLAKTGRSALK